MVSQSDTSYTDRRLGSCADETLSGCDAEVFEQASHVHTKRFAVIINMATGVGLPCVSSILREAANSSG